MKSLKSRRRSNVMILLFFAEKYLASIYCDWPNYSSSRDMPICPLQFSYSLQHLIEKSELPALINGGKVGDFSYDIWYPKPLFFYLGLVQAGSTDWNYSYTVFILGWRSALMVMNYKMQWTSSPQSPCCFYYMERLNPKIVVKNNC